MDDAFREGFEAGFQRGVRVGKLQVTRAVKSRLPDEESPCLGSSEYSLIQRELTGCLLEREARRREWRPPSMSPPE